MVIKNIKFKNFISNNESVEINFLRKYNKEDKTFFEEYQIPNKRSKNNNGILKMISLIGKNASYKTSILRSINKILDFVINFKTNANNIRFNNINLSAAIKWYEKKNGVSPIGKINPDELLEKYFKENKNKQKNDDELTEDYFKYFYDEFAFDKKSPMIFSIEFLDKKNVSKLYSVNINYINGKIYFSTILNKERFNIFNEKIKFTNNFASFEFYNTYGKVTHINDKNIFLINALTYLYLEKFNSNVNKLKDFIKILDPSISLLNIKKFTETKNKNKFRIEFKSITRNYGNVMENIMLSELSTGTKMFIVYLYYILKYDFIIIDELEQSLHKKLVSLLITIARNNNKQLLFSTHDPVVIRENIKMYQLYILNIKENSLKMEVGSESFRDGRDNFINKYINDMVSNIVKSDLDFINMVF